MDELIEAVTIKAQVKSAINTLKTLLKDKTLPKRSRDMVDGIWADMTKTWDTLMAELDGETPEPELAPVAAKESELISEAIPLIEATRGGIVPIKVISAGWGSSGYYSPAVLKRDGPRVFPAGLHMYVDHPTSQEESSRPERSVKDLAAVLQSAAQWDENGKQGPGLYANAKLFSDHAERIREMAPHIGVSIRAMGSAKQGEAEGRKGSIIEAITAGRSVDFVTMAGAGGAVLSEASKKLASAFTGTATTVGTATITGALSTSGSVALINSSESRAAITPAAIETEPTEVQMMTAEETEAFEDLRNENARLREAATLREAGEFVTATLTGIANLHPLTAKRLAESLPAQAVFVEGKLDQDATKKIVEAAANAEIAYLGNVTGAGRIHGMGNGGPVVIDEAKRITDRKAKFVAMGYDDRTAELAASK